MYDITSHNYDREWRARLLDFDWQFVARGGRESVETGAAQPGTQMLQIVSNDVLLPLGSTNNHPEYTAPGLLNDPLSWCRDVSLSGAHTGWSH